MSIKRFIATVALAACTMAAVALPTVDAVQAEVQRGNYAQAEVMMQDVVAAKPGSARATTSTPNPGPQQAFRSGGARGRALAPARSGDRLHRRGKFKSLEQLLEREQSAARPRAMQAPSGGWRQRSSGRAHPRALLQQCAELGLGAGAGWRRGPGVVAGHAAAHGRADGDGNAGGPMMAAAAGRRPTALARLRAGRGAGLRQAPRRQWLDGRRAGGGGRRGRSMLAEKLLHGGHDSGNSMASAMARARSHRACTATARPTTRRRASWRRRPVRLRQRRRLGGDAGCGGGGSTTAATAGSPAQRRCP